MEKERILKPKSCFAIYFGSAFTPRIETKTMDLHHQEQLEERGGSGGASLGAGMCWQREGPVTGRRFDLGGPICMLFISHLPPCVLCFSLVCELQKDKPYLCKGALAKAEIALDQWRGRCLWRLPHWHSGALISWKEKEIYLFWHYLEVSACHM